jgi:hypothetical protein
LRAIATPPRHEKAAGKEPRRPDEASQYASTNTTTPPKKARAKRPSPHLSFPDKKLMANEIWAIVYVNRNGRKQNELRGLPQPI